MRTLRRPVPRDVELDRARLNVVVLAHELVQASDVEDAVAVLVDIYAVRRARRFTIEQHTEHDRFWRSP